MSDSMAKDDKKIEEQIINKLASTCQFHNGEKALNVCITCGRAFCDQCANDHKGHKTINRSDLMKFSEELKESKENIQKSFESLDLVDSYSDTDICKNYREDLNIKCDNVIEIAENIKKKSKTIYNDFKTDFDSIFPYLIEYKEKVEGLYEDSKKETTIRLEKNFVDFYCKYASVKNYSKKINDYLFTLKKKIENFKDILNDFNNRVEKITDGMNQEFALIKDYKFGEEPTFFLNQDISNLKLSGNPLNNSTSAIDALKFNSGNTNFDKKAVSEVRSSHFSSNANFGKMNLVTLLSPPKDKKAFIKMMEHKYKERKNTVASSNNNIQTIRNPKPGENNEISERIEESADDQYINLFYNIEIKTSNLICFNTEDKKITKVEINLGKTSIKKFEPFHSTLDYQGRFYISGGYTTGKMFCKYNKTLNEFIKLPDMPTKHSYHCLLGVGDSIFAISGYKTKKVERYFIDKGTWVSMPELENSRSWPSCISYNDKFIFLFGGLWETSEIPDRTKTVEKLNFNEQNAKWETIEIKSTLDAFPFYFGVLKANNEKLLLLGGKYDAKEDNIDTVLGYNFESNEVSEEKDFKLPHKDEFDGKLFMDLGDGKFGQFSSIYSSRFYIINPETKEIEIESLEEEKKE